MKECPICHRCFEDRERICPEDAGRLLRAMAGPPVLDRKYLLLRRVGGGGMGTVYEARHLGLERMVAVKLLRARHRDREAFQVRFQQEARVLGRLRHPGIVGVTDFGIELDREVAYLVMEHLAGVTLSELVPPGGLDVEEALPILDGIAGALDEAHRSGVVHCDLKRSNVLVERPPAGTDEPPKVHVIDFGLAQVFSGPELPETSDTFESRVSFLGTVLYMAPETIQGKGPSPASDIYAFGVLIYALLTGSYPFKGSSMDLVRSHRDATPELPSKRSRGRLPAKLDRAILKPLAKRPSSRPETAADVVAGLREAWEGVAPAAARVERRTDAPSALRPWERASRQAWRPLLALALALVLVVVAATFYGWRSGGGDGVARARAAVAILGFEDLADREESAWLATALAEMLAFELAAGDALRLVPRESIDRMARELALSPTGDLTSQTLRTLGQRLDADYAVAGSYLLLEGTPPRVRLQLRLQDVTGGKTLAVLRDTGSESELFDLVERTGDEMRRRLRLTDLSRAERRAVRAAAPASPAALRAYSQGLRKLRALDAVGARAAFAEAVGHDPSYALAHASLSEALRTLGRDREAAAAAEEALRLAEGLPREERLHIEGRYYEAAARWDDAVATYQALWRFFPDQLDYGLRLASIQSRAGRAREALATVRALASAAAPERRDPRVGVAEAEAKRFLGDYAGMLEAARRAAVEAHGEDTWLVEAEALELQGSALYQLRRFREARDVLASAQALFERAGDSSHLADVSNLRGLLALGEGDPQNARRLLEEALAVHQERGNRRAVARIWNNLAVVLESTGELAEASDLVEQALRTAREAGERTLTGYYLDTRAWLALRRGDLAGAREIARQELAAAESVGNREEMAWSRFYLGWADFDAGNLTEARTAYEQVLLVGTELGNDVIAAYALHELGVTALAAGDLETAERYLEEARQKRAVLEEAVPRAETEVAFARLEVARERFPQAEELARRAAEDLARAGAVDAELEASLVAVEALRGEGDDEKARQVLTRATRRTSQDPSLRLRVAMAEAQLLLGTEEAAGRLEAAVAEARALRLGALELEIRLVRAEILAAAGDGEAGDVLAGLASEAEARGFGLLAARAAGHGQP